MADVLDIETISDAVAQAADAVDIKRAFLFGSYARGEASEQSDIDICVEAGPLFSLFSAGAFANDIETAVGKQVDLVSEKSLFPHVRKMMNRDKVLIYERS